MFSAFHGHKEKVKDITSDMCHGYRNAMKDAFPEATVTVDRSHVMKMMGDCVDCVRKREMRSKDRRKQEKLNRADISSSRTGRISALSNTQGLMSFLRQMTWIP